MTVIGGDCPSIGRRGNIECDSRPEHWAESRYCQSCRRSRYGQIPASDRTPELWEPLRVPLPEFGQPMLPELGQPVAALSTLPIADPSPTAAPRRAIHISGYERAGRDFYATPAWVTAALLRHVRFRGPIWEPCCGDGAMAAVLQDHGYQVVSTDIADRGFGTPGVDFLASPVVPGGCQSIVTNPPYGDSGSHAGQSRSSTAMLHFLEHAMTLTESVQGQLALLVRLQWIAGRRAAEMMSSGPFAAVITLTRRIRWFDMGEQTNHAQHHHAWVVFDHAHKLGQPPALLYA
jgi:hypothetical protein